LHQEDSILLANFKNPKTKNQAFESLLKKYQQRIYWHVRRMVVDHDDTNDLVQDIFIKVWKNLDNFREDAKLYTWLYRIASNECITFLNRKKLKATVSFDDVSHELADKMVDSEYLDGNKIQMALQKAILTLPDKQRLVFNMKYFEEMKYEEISQIVGTSVGALKASYHFAVKKIENLLKED